MNIGDLASVVQGEVLPITVPFASRLQAGESLIAPAVAKMALWPYSPAPDPNFANLVVGSAVLSGSNVVAVCGGYGAAGFQLGAVYSLYITVATSLGRTLISYGEISCDPLAPPTASSGGVLPNNTVILNADFTANASVIYVANAGGITLTLPASWAANGGPVVFVDGGTFGGTVAGPVLNWTTGSMPLVPGGAMWFFWSSQLNGWVST